MKKLEMETILVEEDLFTALKDLASFDTDYKTNLLQEAKTNGFSDNVDYHISLLKSRRAEGEFESDSEIVDAFCDLWMADKEHMSTCHFDENGNICFIVVAWVNS